MNVEYNTVKLEMGEIQSIHREAVWDDTRTHLLYVKWVIGIVAHYAPNGYPVGVSSTVLRPAFNRPSIPDILVRGVFAFFRGATSLLNTLRGRDAFPTPVVQRSNTPGVAAHSDASAGFGPILTDVTLRARLMTPRQKLRIYGWDTLSGAQVDLLSSPTTGFVCDPANGPHPIAMDIISGQDGGFAVFFQIETATLPCEDMSDRLVLSHVWQTTHQHSDEQYLTRVTEGELVLNGSMVHTFGVFADQFRSQFFHPIPLGFQRKISYVTPSSDGLTYKYRFEDTDPTIVFDAGNSGASHIDIVEKMAYSQPWRILGSTSLLP